MTKKETSDAKTKKAPNLTLPKEDGLWWLGPWSNLVHCKHCHGLTGPRECSVCGANDPVSSYRTEERNGVVLEISQGAVSHTMHSLLLLMKRECERPTQGEIAQVLPNSASEHAMIVILFWTLFEHIFEQLLRTGAGSLPPRVTKDLFNRHQSIGARMNGLYSILFGATMEADLKESGHNKTYDFLRRVQKKRNDFIHGDAEAIDDALVAETLKRLRDVQAAWLAIYNKRCTGNPNAPPVWQNHHAQATSRTSGK